MLQPLTRLTRLLAGSVARIDGTAAVATMKVATSAGLKPRSFPSAGQIKQGGAPFAFLAALQIYLHVTLHRPTIAVQLEQTQGDSVLRCTRFEACDQLYYRHTRLLTLA